jgi:SulP family sulfate permease
MKAFLNKLWHIVPYKSGWRNYTWTSLYRDLLAGLTVASVALPQAMAYAVIAGIEPIYGLYTAIIMTALGSLLGSSRLLINGPTNAISLVVLSTVPFVVGHETLSPQERVQMVCFLGLLVGTIQVIIALLKLGDLTRYISESVVLGFLAGAGLLVALSQVDKLLGIKLHGQPDELLVSRLGQTLVRGLTEGMPINWESVIIGLTTVLVILAFHRLGRRFKIRLPELLLALILVSLGTWLYGWQPGQDGIAALDVPPSLPMFSPPPLEKIHDWTNKLWGGALAISLLGLVEALAIAKSLSARTKESFDYNRQCLAEGLANIGGGLFQSMPGSGSLTRSAINYTAGAATRFSGVVAALTVATTVLLFAPYAKHIPQPALAGVLMWTAYRIVDRQRLNFCLRATRFDAGIALATAFSAVFISIEFSILIGTFLSFLFFVPRASRLHANELILAADHTLREKQPNDPECGRMVILAFEGNLFFGAAPEFEEHLEHLKLRVTAGVKVIVLRLKRVRNPDMVCLELLLSFLCEMKEREVPVLLCGVREEFVNAMKRLRFERVHPSDRTYPEEASPNTSTLQAVRRAYEILGEELCATCPRREKPTPPEGQDGLHYVI